MSIEEQDLYYSYIGNGVTAQFPFNCRIFEAADLSVTVAGAVKALGVDYYITGVDANGGGNVNFVAGSIPAGGSLVELERVLDYSRPTGYIQNGNFRPEIVDKDQDRQTALVQQIAKSQLNYIKLPPGMKNIQLPAATPGALLAWDNVGSGLQNLLTAPPYVSTTVSASAYGTDLSAAITAIGSARVRLVVDSPITVNDYLTLPSTLQLHVDQPGLLIIADSKTLTINGPLSAGVFQIFEGTGTVYGLKKTLPEWFGASGTVGIDDKAAFDAAIIASDIIYLQADKSYYVSELAVPTHKKIIGLSPSKEYSKTKIYSIGIATNPLNALIYNSGTVSSPNRDVCVQNVTLIESIDAPRTYGLFSQYHVQSCYDNIFTYGFDIGIFDGIGWNNISSSIKIYNFRNTGISFGYDATRNGSLFYGLHISTNIVTATENIKLAGHSVLITNLVTEGSAISHFRVDAHCSNITIIGIHSEGTGNIIMVDLDTASPSYPFCTFNFLGGYIYISPATGRKFVNVCGTRANIGLSHLNLNGVTLVKCNTSNSFPEDYFSIPRVANFTDYSYMNVTEDALDEPLEWKNVAVDISRTYSTSRRGATGSNAYTRNRQYSGLINSYSANTQYNSLLNSSPGTPIISLPLDSNKWRVAIVDILVGDVGSTSMDSSSNYARFRITVSRDFSAISATELIDYTQGVIAKSTTFNIKTDITNVVNNGSGLIRVTSPSHGLATNSKVKIKGVVGATEANGYWYIVLVDSNTFDLVSSTFSNAYISGGYVTNGFLKALNVNTSYNYSFTTTVMEY